MVRIVFDARNMKFVNPNIFFFFFFLQKMSEYLKWVQSISVGRKQLIRSILDTNSLCRWTLLSIYFAYGSFSFHKVIFSKIDQLWWNGCWWSLKWNNSILSTKYFDAYRAATHHSEQSVFGVERAQTSYLPSVHHKFESERWIGFFLFWSINVFCCV